MELNPELQRGVTPPGKHVIKVPASLVKKKVGEQTAETETPPEK
jgi:hypothetical protein